MMKTTQIITDEYRPFRLGESDSVCYKHKVKFQSGSAETGSEDPQQDKTVEESQVVTSNTTKFVDEGVLEIVKPASYMTIPKTSLSTAQYDAQTIAHFLAKPRVFMGLTIPVNTLPSLLATKDISALIDTSTSDIWGDKLKGVYGIKYDSVFTLKINGSRFAQGLLLLAFEPLGGAAITAVPNSLANSRMQLTQMKHCIADINCDTSVTLEVPWISAFPFQRVAPYTTGREGHPGRIRLAAYSNYRSADVSDDLRITVFQSLTNITFFGNAWPQSLVSDLDFDPSPLPGVHFQAGKMKKINKPKDPLTSEEETSRPISGGFRLIADVSSALSAVPLLSTFTTPISWVSDAISRAAYVWGYSAPRAVEAPVRAFTSSTPYLTTYDKHSTAEPLSLALSNKVSPALGFSGTDKDEMSIDFLKSIFSYYTSVEWTTADVDESKILSIDLAPFKFAQVISNIAAGGDYKLMTPAAYLCHLFARWRGSIKLRLYFSKTEFHRGRLALTYSPNGSTTSYDDTDFLLREIVDIRSGNMIELTIPYVHNHYWRDSSFQNGSIGSFEIWVIDTLAIGGIASTTSSVDILVEVAFGDDAQFAVRSNIRMISTNATTAFQSGTEMDPCEIEVTSIGSSTVVNKNYDIVAMTMGEPVESLSQLLKAGGFNLGEVSTTGRGLAHSIAGCNTLATFPNAQTDLYSAIVPLYALMRGGVRVTFQSSRRDLASPLYVGMTYGQDNRVPLLRSSTDYNTRSVMLVNSVNTGVVASTADNGAVTVDFPPYARFPASPVAHNILYDPTPVVSYLTGTIQTNYFIRCMDTSITPTLYVHRAVSDDFRCGVFVAIPTFYVHYQSS